MVQRFNQHEKQFIKNQSHGAPISDPARFTGISTPAGPEAGAPGGSVRHDVKTSRSWVKPSGRHNPPQRRKGGDSFWWGETTDEPAREDGAPPQWQIASPTQKEINI